MALQLVHHFSRTLVNGYREVVFAIHGAEGAKKADINALGPQVGDIDKATGLKVTSRHVSSCVVGISKFKKNAKLKKPSAAVIAKLKERTAASLAKVLGVRTVNLKPRGPRCSALRLRIWYQPAVMSESKRPWKDRVPLATAKDLEEIKGLL